MVGAFCGLFKNLSLTPRYFPNFSSESFTLLLFTFRDMVYFKLTFVCEMRQEMKVFSPGRYSILFSGVSVCLFTHVSHNKSWYVMVFAPPALFFCEMPVAILGSSAFPGRLVTLLHMLPWDCYYFCIESIDQRRRKLTFSIIILTREHCLSCHLVKSFKVSLNNVLQYLVWKSCP